MGSARFWFLISFSASALWAERKVRSLRLLVLSGTVGVAAIVSVLSLSFFLQSSLISSSSELLAGDRQLTSPRALPATWLAQAGAFGLQHSLAVEFRTMIFAKDESTLVLAKAVSDNYPLKGQLRLGDGSEHVREGSLYVQPRLVSLLSLDVGSDSDIWVGDRSLGVTAALVSEPDLSLDIGGLQPRVLMHLNDVESTNVLSLGSRSTWRYFFAGDQPDLQRYDTWLDSRLTSAQRYEGVEGARPAIADALAKAETFLLLSACLATLLSTVAIALSSQQYAAQGLLSVALLKTLGLQSRDVVLVYFSKLLLIAMLVVGLGFLGGQLGAYVLYALVNALMAGASHVSAYITQWSTLGIAALTAVITIFGFGFAQIYPLRGVSPQLILRPERGQLPSVSALLPITSVCLILTLLLSYTGSPVLVLMFVGLGVGLVAVCLILSYLILKMLALVNDRAFGSSSGLAVGTILAQRRKAMFQAVVYSVAISLVLVMAIVRHSLVSQWQAQLPADAPNHFLLNIRDSNLAQIEQFFENELLSVAHLYPIVRGRLTHINDSPVKVAVTKDIAALNRELNLSWRDTLPSDNRLTSGRWFGDSKTKRGVSVESDLASKLGLGVGDQLRFDIGGELIEVPVISIRTVEWDSMQPNFYMLFDSASLKSFPKTYITSVFISDDQKTSLNKLAKEFPTVSVLELDGLISKISGIVAKVTAILGFVFLLALFSSVLVVIAVLFSDINSRTKHSALLRVFGVKAVMIRRSYFIEFFIIGLIASISAVVCAQLAVGAASTYLIGSPVVANGVILIGIPLVCALGLGVFATLLLHTSVKATPMQSLREELG